MSTRPDAAPPYLPRYPTLVAIAVCTVWVVVLFLPMFAGYFLGGDHSDQTWTGIPFRNFWADEVRGTGSVPVWNPYMFGGMPFIGAMHGDIFYPTSFLRVFLGAAQTLNLTFFLHLILAGVFTFTFLRAIGTTWTAALVGGLAYQLSGIVVSQVSPGHDGKMIVSALLPLLLTGLVLAIRRRRLEGYALVALVVGLDILSPQTQMAQYSFIFAGIFTLYLCFWDEARPVATNDRLIALGLATAAVALGFGLSMIQVYPFIANAPYAARWAGAQGWEYSTAYAMPAANIFDWVLATFTGSSVWGIYWAGAVKLHSEYLGAGVVALAIIGMINPRRRLTWVLAGCFALFLLVCLGAQTPFYRLWYELVPGVNKTRAPGMAFFIPAFIVSCFAAFGVERLERREPSRLPWFLLAAAGLILLLGISGGFQMLAEGMAGQLAPYVQQIAGEIRLGAVLAAVAMAAAAGIAIAAIRGRLAPPVLAAALALVVSADLFVNARRSFTWKPGETELFAPDEIITRVKATPVPYRVLDVPLQGESSYPTAYLMYHRIPNVLGHHGNELHYYDELLGGKNVWTNVGSPRIWDMLAVRYILMPSPFALPGYHVAAVTRAPGAAGYRRRVPEVLLYEADTLPRYARVVPAALKVAEEQIVPTLLDARLDPNRLVLLPETTSHAVPAIDSIPPAMAARATVTAWAPGAMSIRLDPVPERDGWLVVAENWYPDWQATVDGRDAPVLRGQKTLLAIPLAAGARDVELRMARGPAATGRAMTLASLAGILVWFAVPLVRRRKRG